MVNTRCASVEYGNQNLLSLNEDVLYHLGLSTKSTDFRKTFHDVRYVCLGGSPSRMKKFAQQLAAEMKLEKDVPNLAAAGGRFSLFKVGSVLVADHGMGTPSISILLHELFKLLRYAGCKDVIFFRMGTCGGLGVPPGTLMIPKECVNTQFQPVYELRILGKLVTRPTFIDPGLVDELVALSNTIQLEREVLVGKTLCANDFYEEQARLDGAFCDYTEKDKNAYLLAAYDAGIRGLEMEGLCFTAQCHLAGFKAAMVCVTLVDRLKSDQVQLTPKQYQSIQFLPGNLLIAYMKKHDTFHFPQNQG
ncbi:unnamed protein product [Calicophoron daubneyi]